MAQYLTIDEAAAKLNLSVAEFKKRLRTEWVGKIRPFQDGATQRFRANEIDELARSIGLGSSEELQLADSDELELPTEINLELDDAPAKPPEQTQAVGRPSKHTQAAPPPPHVDDEPLKLDDDTLKLESDDVFLLTPDEPPAKPAKPGSDSDVRLEKSSGTKKSPPQADDEESILTEEFDLPTGSSVKLTGKSGKLSSSKLMASDSGKGKAQPTSDAEPDSSEFELSLAPDSDEFELSLTPDSSEEVSLGESIEPKKAGQSGINLNRPADSGVSLEKKGKPPAKPAAKQEDSDEEIDFELSLDAPGSGKSATKLGSNKRLQADSDSEFELTLEEPSDLALDNSDAGTAEKKDDIFEATDFEIPALDDDSASEAIALDEGDTDLESSDFDLALDDAEASVDDDSASQVVALDDEEDAPRPKNRKKAVEDDSDVVDIDELDDDEGAGAALRGVRADDDDDLEVTEAAEDDERPVVVSSEPAPWGALPALMMFPTLLVLFFGAIMAYELLHSAWGYSQPNKPTTPLVNWAAETTGMK